MWTYHIYLALDFVQTLVHLHVFPSRATMASRHLIKCFMYPNVLVHIPAKLLTLLAAKTQNADLSWPHSPVVCSVLFDRWRASAVKLPVLPCTYVWACVLVSGGLLARWGCVSLVCALPSPSFTLILSVPIEHLPPVCFNLCNRILQFSSSDSFGFSLFSPSHSHSVCLSLSLFILNLFVLSRNRTTIPVH